jgi:hypothetical protein
MLALVAGAALLALLACHRPPAAEPELDAADLEAALLARVERSLGLVVRFSGATELPPCASADAVVCGAASPTLDDLPRLVQMLHRTTTARPLDPGALRAQALWALLRHATPEARARAVALLALAHDLDPQPPRRNDLAAALLLRGAVDQRPSDLVEALELAEQVAAEVAATVPEASFNRALALTQLTLHAAAAERWRELAASDVPQPWVELARAATAATAAADALPKAPPEPAAVRATERSGTSTATLSTQQPGPPTPPGPAAPTSPAPDALPLRRQGEASLGAWALAATHEGAAASVAQALAAAESAAARHRTLSGDALLADAAALCATARGGRLAQLVAGHAAYARARGDALYAACGEDLDRATQALTAAESPFAGWPLVDQAICAFYAQQFALADRRLAEALALARRGGYPSLEGRVHWISGLVRMVQGRHAAAARALGDALTAFTAIHEPTHVDYLHALLAQTLENTGDRVAAWRHRLRALAHRERLDPERSFTVLDHAAAAAREAGWRHAAAYFLDAQVRAAEAAAATRREAADIASKARLERSTLQRETGDLAAAAADLERARRWWETLAPDWPTRRRLERELAVQAALLPASAGADAADAVPAIDAAIALFAAAGPDGDQIEILRLLRLRAAALRQAGALDAAEETLRRALAEIERQRLGLAARAERARFAAQAGAVGRELVALLLARSRDAEALRLVEETTQRSWRELAGRAREPLAIGSLRAPADTLLLRYAVLADRLVAWTLQGNELLRREVPIAETRLRRTVELCREEILAGQHQGTFCARTAALLLPPAIARLGPGGQLGIVADELTRNVPFAALPLGPGGPHLVEQLEVSFLPSLLFPPPSPRPSARQPPSSGLFVVDPSFPAADFPNLSRLAAARAALPGLQALHPDATTLVDDQASRRRVLAKLPHARFAQFEAHGIQSEDGGPVGLLLAPDPAPPAAATPPPARPSEPTGDPPTASPRHPAPAPRADLLTPDDLLALPLGGLELAVLAGCSTSPSPLPGGLELDGLPLALLAAGAREVIATGWPIEDRATSALLADFHRCWASGRRATTCLREAQLAGLASQDPHRSAPRAWAAFQVWTGTWNPPPASVYERVASLTKPGPNHQEEP